MQKHFVEIMVPLCSACYVKAKADYGEKILTDIEISKTDITGFEDSECGHWLCDNKVEFIITFKRGRTLVFPPTKSKPTPPPGRFSCNNTPIMNQPAIGGRPPMDTKKLIQEIQTAVQAKITADEEFTAHDITKVVRAANPNEDVPHHLVRAQVKEEHTSGRMGSVTLDYRDFGGKTATVYNAKTTDADDADDSTDATDATDDAVNTAVKSACGG